MMLLTDGYERKVEDCPDNVEAPMEGCDAGGCNFDDHEVEYPAPD